jgi:hypothetical protein
VRQLWTGIPSKVTNAARAAINRVGQFFRAEPLSIPNPFSVRPVLAEKTVKGASMIKNRKILKPIFWTGAVGKLWIPNTRSTWTDPIGDTISGKSIIIPTDISLCGGDSLKDSLSLSPETAIAPAPFWNLTPIDADLARNA